VKKTSIAERLDNLYEFDREPVTQDKLQGAGSFIGMYAGEHVAGTEFVIGPLFVAHGVSAPDLFLGLVVGNILAVLSWVLLCTPIAVRTRLTLYWQLRKICGPYLTFLYSIVNALMFCFLAGAMIAVSATAVGIPFKMPMPELGDMFPTSISWVVIVFLVGTIVTGFAILGFEKFSQFSKICAPWMFLIFVAAGLAVLPKLGCTSLGDFWRVAKADFIPRRPGISGGNTQLETLESYLCSRSCHHHRRMFPRSGYATPRFCGFVRLDPYANGSNYIRRFLDFT